MSIAAPWVRSSIRCAVTRHQTPACICISQQKLARYSSFPPRSQRPPSPPDYDTSHSPPSPVKEPWKSTSSAPPGKTTWSAPGREDDDKKSRVKWIGFTLAGLVGAYFLVGRSSKSTEQKRSN